MWRLLRVSLTVLGLVPAGTALAEREIHVVAVGKGQKTQDAYALPEAHVLVDRPGQEIALVLLDGGILRWHVSATPGSVISEIVRSGPGPKYSEIRLSGIPVEGVHVSGFPLVFKPVGRKFVALVDRVTDWMGSARIDSFHGTPRFTGQTLRVDRVQRDRAEFAPGYLETLLAPADDLPEALRLRLESGTEIGAEAAGPSVAFDGTGMRLRDDTGTRHFPVRGEVPGIVLPVMGVFDPEGERIYGVTYGAEGYVYAVDTRSGTWTTFAALDGYDAAHLFYDPGARLLIMTGGFSRPGDIRALGLGGGGFSIFVPTTGFPGLTDLFDFGNEDGPPLRTRGYSEGWLLLEATGDRPDHGTAPSRFYALQVKTGEVRLLRYRN